jgi:RND family efflux transporter MFP subunit
MTGHVEPRAAARYQGSVMRCFPVPAALLGAALAFAYVPARAAGIGDAQVSCVVLPSQQINLSSAVPGIVRAVLVERGERVRKGEPLLQLIADTENAQADLAKTKAGLAKRKLERNKDVIRKHLLSDMERDQLETDAAVAQQEYEVARRIARQKTTVSPINGIVVSRKVEPGQYVGTDPVFELANLDPLYVELVFRVAAYGKIKPGMAASIALGPPVGKSRNGKVVIVDKVIDARSQTFRVRVRLPNPGLKIPSGIGCKANF